MKRNYLCLCLSFLICNLNLSSQSLDEKLDRYLETELTKFEIPNLEIRIIKKGQPIYERSFGKDGGQDKPYYIGSVSKSLTAFATMRLIEQGKLNLDQRFHTILPQIQTNNKDITIRHLLNHTSGISKKAGFKTLPTLADLGQSTFSIKSQFTPGSQHEYSNLNYSILGLIIEKISRKSFDQFLQTEVFDPLKMQNASAGKEKQNIIPQHQYYYSIPKESEQSDFNSTVIPAGFITASANDLGKYISANLLPDSLKALLHPNLYQEMHTAWNKESYGYAMGWKKGSMNGVNFLQHLGSTATSYAAIFILPESETGFVLLSNSNSLSFTEDIAKGVLQSLCNMEPEAASNTENYIRWGAGFLLLFAFLNFLWKLIKLFTNKTKPTKAAATKSLLINLNLALILFFGFPFLADIPFLSFFEMQRDLGITVVALTGLPIVLSFIQFFFIGKQSS